MALKSPKVAHFKNIPTIVLLGCASLIYYFVKEHLQNNFIIISTITREQNSPSILVIKLNPRMVFLPHLTS